MRWNQVQKNSFIFDYPETSRFIMFPLLTWNRCFRLEEATGLAFRFIIGRTNVQWKMSVLNKEVAQHDDFILLDIEEEYSKLPYKTLVPHNFHYLLLSSTFRFIWCFTHCNFIYRLAYFKAAYALFDSEFYVKADDDIYLRPGKLSFWCG